MTQALQELHWLPIAQRIDYKLCLLVYKSRTGHAPAYVSDMLTPAADVTSRATRSSTNCDYFVRRNWKLKRASCHCPGLRDSSWLLCISIKSYTAKMLSSFFSHWSVFDLSVIPIANFLPRHWLYECKRFIVGAVTGVWRTPLTAPQASTTYHACCIPSTTSLVFLPTKHGLINARSPTVPTQLILIYFNKNQFKFKLYTTMTSLWHNLSVNVAANSKWICLLTSAPKVHWRVQPERQIQQDAGVCVHCTCQGTVSKCLKMNNGHLIPLQIWMAFRYRLGSDAWIYFETFIPARPEQFLN